MLWKTLFLPFGAFSVTFSCLFDVGLDQTLTSSMIISSLNLDLRLFKNRLRHGIRKAGYINVL